MDHVTGVERVETFCNIRYLEIRVSEARLLGRVTYETKPVPRHSLPGEGLSRSSVMVEISSSCRIYA